MKCFKYHIIIGVFLLMRVSVSAQVKGKLTEEDKSALEGIVVEKYYSAEATDVKDTTGGVLTKGAVTYRIYADLKKGYNLQAVYGVPKHELYIKTSTHFFNNTNGGATTGDKIEAKKINDNTVALDSWITLGAATEKQYGIIKDEDKDGSVINKKQLTKADGLIAAKIKPVTYFGIDLGVFASASSASFSTNNGSWAMFGGITGPTETNKILIAQITTDGKLSFELNLQVGTPTGASVQFVARNPEEKEIQSNSLIQQ